MSTRRNSASLFGEIAVTGLDIREVFLDFVEKSRAVQVPTQKSPAPFVGLIAGLGAVDLLMRMRR